MKDLSSLINSLTSQLTEINVAEYERRRLLIDVIFELEYIEIGVKALGRLGKDKPIKKPGKRNKKLVFYLSGILLHLRILRDILSNGAVFNVSSALMNRVIAHPSLGKIGARRLNEIKIINNDIYIEYYGDKSTKSIEINQDALIDNAEKGRSFGKGKGIERIYKSGDTVVIDKDQFAGSLYIINDMLLPIINYISSFTF